MATTVTLKPNAIDISGSTSGTTTLQATAVAGTTTVTLPAATDTLVGRATTDTLTNKTLTSPTITGGALNGTLGATTPNTVAATSITASTTLSVTGEGSISGLTVGKGGGSISTNTAVGASALSTNTTGANNVAVGYVALASNTSGSLNVGVGVNALNSTTTGTENTGLGTSALTLNTTGSSNTAVGRQALVNNTTASNNTAVGYQAGFSNTTGINIAAFGYQAAYSNTTGEITALGRKAGYSNTTSSASTYIGDSAGFYATGVSNTFVGGDAGSAVTTGAKNTIIGRYTGNNGGLDIRTASNNIVLSDGDGNPRLVGNANGSFVAGKTVFGQILTSGFEYNNTSGAQYLSTCTDASANTALWVANNGTTGSRQLVNFYAGGSSVGSITSTGSATAYNTSSDYRLKNTIAPMTGALAKVQALKPVTYKWNADGSDGEGFIAHELAEVCPHAVTGEKDAVNEDGSIKPQGIDTSFLVATLTAALQELKALVDAQATEIAELKAKVA